jgi:two-component system sensor histidine kinase QseC
MRRSLSADLMLSTALTLLAGMLCVFGSWALVSRYQPSWIRDSDLENMARNVAGGVVFDADGRPTGVNVGRRLRPVLTALPHDVFFQVLDRQRRVVLSSNGSSASALPESVDPATVAAILETTTAGLPARMKVTTLETKQGPLFVLMSRSDRFDETLLADEARSIRLSALVTIVAAMLVFSAAIFVTMNRMLRRVRGISAAAARIDPANLKSRLATEEVPRELTPLIDSFNGALERLEAGFRIQQEFLAAAAHELKTPLALVRGEIELRGATNKARILSDLDHMNRQVHQLLHLAEVSDAGSLALSMIDPCVVVQDVADFIERLARARHVAVLVRCPDQPLRIRADSSALFILVRNLVENAVHHAPDRSTVLLEVDALGIAVRDEGPGIPAADLPLLFQRFWRGGHRRDDGAGLGLSICNEIARGHGWRLTAANRTPSGAEFRVRFS